MSFKIIRSKAFIITLIIVLVIGCYHYWNRPKNYDKPSFEEYVGRTSLDHPAYIEAYKLISTDQKKQYVFDNWGNKVFIVGVGTEGLKISPDSTGVQRGCLVVDDCYFSSWVKVARDIPHFRVIFWESYSKEKLEFQQ